MDGQSVADGMAPFSRNGKCRRLSSHGLDGRLHFACVYYIILRVGVNSLEIGCDYRRIEAEKCLHHNEFSLRFHCSKGIVLATGKSGFYSSTQELEVDRTSSRVSTFREKSHCAAMTFHRISIETRLLYVPFGKCLSDVDKIAFSAFRTRFSASEYTYTIPPKMGRKSHCGATTFGGLNA